MDNVVVGHLCQDPVVRQVKRGDRPVVRLRVAVNGWRRIGGEFIPRPPVFHEVVCFGPLAENVSNSLGKGAEVVAVGEWVDDSYSDASGQRHVRIALEARAVGAALRRATVSVHRNQRSEPDEAVAASDAGPAADGPVRAGLELITGDPVPRRDVDQLAKTARAG